MNKMKNDEKFLNQLEEAERIDSIRRMLINRNRLTFGAKILIPSILTAALSFGTFKYLGFGFPFFIDSIKQYSETRTEINKYGETSRTLYQERNFIKDTAAYITYYGTWQLTENDKYKREVTKYAITNSDIENIETEEQIKDLIARSVGSGFEETTDMEVINSGQENYYSIVLYDGEHNNYIKIAESKDNNKEVTVIYIVLNFIFGGFLTVSSFARNYDSYNKRNKNINEAYANDRKKLIKELKK